MRERRRLNDNLPAIPRLTTWSQDKTINTVTEEALRLMLDELIGYHRQLRQLEQDYQPRSDEHKDIRSLIRNIDDTLEHLLWRHQGITLKLCSQPGQVHKDWKARWEQKQKEQRKRDRQKAAE